MKELVSFSTHHREREILKEGLPSLLREFSLAGIELLPLGEVPEQILPRVVGVHLPFQPVWLPFWFEDQSYLKEVFPGAENLAYFFGGKRPADFVARVRSWFEKALALKPAYIVIHASHCGLEEVFSFAFRYDTETVLSAVAELLNAALEGLDFSENAPLLLFENLWWPGLRTFSRREVELLFGRLNLPLEILGLALDTSHLLNVSYLLGQPHPIHGPVSPTQALSLLLSHLEEMSPEIRKFIRVVHLNFSPRADLFGPDHQGLARLWREPDSLKRYHLARKRVLALDPHLPFEGVKLGRLFQFLEPDFLVHELRFKELASFKEALKRQKRSLL